MATIQDINSDGTANTLLKTGSSDTAGKCEKTSLAETDVQDAVTKKHASGSDNQIASGVPNTPAGNIASTDVQGAINELDTEKLATGAIAADSDKLDGQHGSYYQSNALPTSNLLRNGGFYLQPEGFIMPYWTRNGDATCSALINEYYHPDNFDTNAGAFRLTTALTDYYSQTLTALKPSTRYYLSFWGRLHPNSQGNAGRVWTTGAGTNIDITIPINTSVYTRFTGYFDTDVSGTNVVIKIGAMADAVYTDPFIDSMCVYESATAREYQP